MNPHLDLIDYDQDAALMTYAGQFLEVSLGRDYVSAGTLNRFYVKRREFRLVGFAVPYRVVLGIEQLFELFDTIESTVFALQVIRAAEAVREWDELCSVREMAVAATVAIAGSN